MHRLYLSPLPEPGRFAIRGDEAHHLLRVKRLQPGERVEAFDGSGGSREGVLVESRAGEAIVEFAADRRNDESGGPRVVLACAVSKPRAMDWLLEKCAELGVAEIRPFVSERSVVRVAGKEQSKLEKWERIAVAAAKQCGRSRLPVICPPCDFGKILEEKIENGRKFILDPAAEVWLSDAAGESRSNQMVLGLVGPEGGFTSGENEQAVAAGFTPVRISENVLRVETACVAFVAMAMAFSKKNR